MQRLTLALLLVLLGGLAPRAAQAQVRATPDLAVDAPPPRLASAPGLLRF